MQFCLLRIFFFLFQCTSGWNFSVNSDKRRTSGKLLRRSPFAPALSLSVWYGCECHVVFIHACRRYYRHIRFPYGRDERAIPPSRSDAFKLRRLARCRELLVRLLSEQSRMKATSGFVRMVGKCVRVVSLREGREFFMRLV